MGEYRPGDGEAEIPTLLEMRTLRKSMHFCSPSSNWENHYILTSIYRANFASIEVIAGEQSQYPNGFLVRLRSIIIASLTATAIISGVAKIALTAHTHRLALIRLPSSFPNSHHHLHSPLHHQLDHNRLVRAVYRSSNWNSNHLIQRDVMRWEKYYCDETRMIPTIPPLLFFLPSSCVCNTHIALIFSSIFCFPPSFLLLVVLFVHSRTHIKDHVLIFFTYAFIV